MKHWSLIATLTLALPAAPAAQTILEATAANVGLATDLCLRVMIDRQAPSAVFQQAGFVYRQTDRGVNQYGVHRGQGHYFDAPADTAKAEVPDPNAPGGLCTVLTARIAEPDVARIVGAAIFRNYPGAEARAGNQWIVRVGANLPLIVQTNTIQRHRYEAPGTVRVSMSYPG